MILLNDLRNEQKELIEVPNDELVSVVGGAPFNQQGFFGVNGATNQGVSATLKIPNTATNLGANTNGTVSFDTNLSPQLQVTGAANLNNGAFKADAALKATDSLSVGIGGSSDGSVRGGIGFTF
jgi:hypothetical protein